MTHVLYDLASSPEYIQPLREEVQTLIAEEGWSKATMGKLWKMDSFLKESLRYNGIALSRLISPHFVQHISYVQLPRQPR